MHLLPHFVDLDDSDRFIGIFGPVVYVDTPLESEGEMADINESEVSYHAKLLDHACHLYDAADMQLQAAKHTIDRIKAYNARKNASEMYEEHYQWLVARGYAVEYDHEWCKHVARPKL